MPIPCHRAEEDGTHYLVMEHLKGRTLRELLASEGRLTVDRAIDFALQICKGLDHAHRQGVVHGDLKPANLMVTPEKEIKGSLFELMIPEFSQKA